MKIFIFSAVLLVQILCKNIIYCYAAQSIERFSDACGQAEDIIEPPLNFTDPFGNSYKLCEREVETISVTGEWKDITEEVLYEGINQTEPVPLMITVQVWDSKSRTSVQAELSLRESFLSEAYQVPVSFPVTLHRFGVDVYQFGEMEIPAAQIPEQLLLYEDLILSEAGLEPEDTELQSFVWGEDVYEDPEGNVCRDVIASGLRQVWDRTAIYEAEVKMPDYSSFREKYRYEKVEEVRQENITAPDSGPPASASEAAETGKTSFRDTIKRIVRICLEITIGLFFVALLVFGLWGLMLLWKKWQKNRDE